MSATLATMIHDGPAAQAISSHQHQASRHCTRPVSHARFDSAHLRCRSGPGQAPRAPDDRCVRA